MSDRLGEIRARLERIREVYPRDRPKCAWCGVRHPQHNFDCPAVDVHYLLDALATAERERDEQRTRAVMAEHHKSLSLLGRSSYAEVQEDKLREQLAVPPADGIPLMCVLAAAVEMMEAPQSVDAVDPSADIRERGPRA